MRTKQRRAVGGQVLACALLLVSQCQYAMGAEQSISNNDVTNNGGTSQDVSSFPLDKDGYVVHKTDAQQTIAPNQATSLTPPATAVQSQPTSSTAAITVVSSQNADPTAASTAVEAPITSTPRPVAQGSGTAESKTEAEIDAQVQGNQKEGAIASHASTTTPRRAGQEAKLSIHYPDNYPFPLVAIQFPVDYEDTFSSEVGQLPAFHKYPAETVSHFVNEQVVRSSYLACALYEHLSEILPDKCIELIPTKLHFDKTSNKVVAIPATKPVPSVVQVDVLSDFNLNRLKNPSQLKSSDTFGERNRTYVSMSMPVNGQPQVFAGEPELVSQLGDNKNLVESFYNALCNGQKSKNASKLGDLPVSSKSVYTPGTFLSIPMDFRSDYHDLLTEPAKKQVAYYANVIVDALNTQSLDEAKKTLLSEYASDIDAQLAEFIRSNGAQAAPVMAKNKLNYCIHCLIFERKHLYTRDAYALAKELWSDKFASLYRDSVKAEADYARQLAASQRRSAIGSFISVASIAGSVAGAFVPTGVPISSMCTVMAFTAGRAVAVERKLQQQLREDYIRHSGAVRTCEVSCVVMLDNDKIVVDGDSMEQHRANVVREYQRKFGTTTTASAPGTAI